MFKLLSWPACLQDLQINCLLKLQPPCPWDVHLPWTLTLALGTTLHLAACAVTEDTLHVLL